MSFPTKTNFIIVTLMFVLLSCNSAKSEMTSTDQPETPKESITVTETVAAPTIPTFQFEESCEKASPADIWKQKGLLFYEYDSSLDVSRIWLWSINMEAPELILETKSKVNFFLSSNKEKLAWHKYDESTFTVYDLISKKYSNYSWQTKWQSITGWTQEGNIAILLGYQKTYHEGITSDYVYFNELTQKTESKRIILNLSGYNQDESSKNPLDGFAIVDPANSRVLYTSDEENPGEFILQDIESGQRLWQDQTQYPFYPYPDWSSSGNLVAYIKYLDEHPVLYTLSRDGKMVNTIGVVSPNLNEVIRELKWSLDEEYIYYAVWRTINEGNAYILSMSNREVREVCSEDWRFLNGYWLNDNQFAYVVSNELQPFQYGMGELRILDADNWNYSVIYRTENRLVSPFDLAVIGEFPNIEK